MMNENEVMAPVAEQVNNVVEQDTCPVVDDSVDSGHKVIFYVILGLIGISGIGLPIMIWLLIKERKKRKQLEDALNAQTTSAPATTETQAPAAESQETKPAEATPEQK